MQDVAEHAAKGATIAELSAATLRSEPRDADEEIRATESRSEKHFHQSRKRRRSLQARALADLQNEVFGAVRRSDVRQGGDLDLVYVALRRTGEKRVRD